MGDQLSGLLHIAGASVLQFQIDIWTLGAMGYQPSGVLRKSVVSILQFGNRYTCR